MDGCGLGGRKGNERMRRRWRTNAWPAGPAVGQLIMPHWAEALKVGRKRCGGVVVRVVGKGVIRGSSRRRTRGGRR